MYMCVYVCVCVYVCMYVCVYVYVYVLSVCKFCVMCSYIHIIRTYIHTYIHAYMYGVLHADSIQGMTVGAVIFTDGLSRMVSPVWSAFAMFSHKIN